MKLAEALSGASGEGMDVFDAVPVRPLSVCWATRLAGCPLW